MMQDQRPAALEQQHAGAESDRGEERVLQRRLQRGVEGQRPPVERVADGEERGDGQAAGDGRGNVVARERRNQPLEAVADEQNQTGEGDGLNEIELHVT